MTGNHAHNYVGRHRKPDQVQQPDPPIAGLLRRTFGLFTHSVEPMHPPKEIEK